MTNQYIEVSKLVKSSLNVRKTVSRTADKELKASIRAHGLMQNLVVTDAGDGTYQVIAGARRLAALQELIEKKKLPADFTVPCQVAAEDDASELSLAENTVRQAMHPADEFEAFAALAGQDATPEQIAKRFGVTAKHVQQRLKLGRVAPELLAEYRTEKIDLECLMAFTLTDDHGRQLSVYKSLQGWQKSNARRIRGCLTDQMVSGTNKLAKFVGLDAYREAGGKVKADLFGEEVFLEDSSLLNRLAGEKLEAEAAKLRQEGWGWVEIGELNYSARSRFGKIQSVPLDAPADLVAELEAAEAEQLRIAEQIDSAYEAEVENEELVEGLEAQATAIEQKLEGITERLESFAGFDPEQMKSAGCCIDIGYDGELAIEKGMVKPGDKKSVAKAAGSASDDEQPDEKPKGMSESLKRDLEAYRLAAARVELTRNPALAFDLLVFGIARGTLDHRSPSDGPDVHFTQGYSKPSVEYGDAVQDMESIKEGLPTKWLKQETPADQFLAFRELPEFQLPEFQKHALLAYCTALTLKPKLAPAEGKEPTAYDMALAMTGAHVADYWRPTRENYLSRITKDQLLALGGGILGAEWSRHRKDSKKAQLVDLLHRAFEEPEQHGETPEQIERLRNWLPEGMAFPSMAEPKPAKKSKKAA